MVYNYAFTLCIIEKAQAKESGEFFQNTHDEFLYDTKSTYVAKSNYASRYM